ncbi:MAG: hypothetical protein IJQ11_04910 [Bacteroidales bacterium]|nr:hypothetical protein [Bacteroidales bacterium]
MLFKNYKSIVLLLGLMLPAAWCGATGTCSSDGHSHIQVKEATLQGIPRGYSIHASIYGHTLTVFFSENIGPVAIEIFKDSGGNVETHWVETPDGLQTYLPFAGDYLITFTLANGDEYYGEFSVMD